MRIKGTKGSLGPFLFRAGHGVKHNDFLIIIILLKSRDSFVSKCLVKSEPLHFRRGIFFKKKDINSWRRQ